jgi:ArsR family transcriptional regulator, cadmium/lead-responsive transcriptional repressor
MAQAGPSLLGQGADAEATAAAVAKFFRALGDPTRLRLLEFLLGDEHTVNECVAHVGLAQSRVSTHLSCLADCGYVEVRRAGRYAFYRVSDHRVADLVRLARALAADNACALSECRRIDAHTHKAAIR